MMYGFCHPSTRAKRVNSYTYACLIGLCLFALLSTKTWLTGAWNSLPDPDTFPVDLRAVYRELAERFRCDFNEGHACEFSLGRGWSFRQSFQEFALKVQQAAAAAVQGTNESDDQPFRNLPEPDHFLCSVPSPVTNAVDQARLEVQIPWPRFIPFAIPLNYPADTTRAASASTPAPTSKRVARSGEIISHTVDVPESIPVACMQLSLRFPPERAVQVNLSFDSVVQVVTLESAGRRSHPPNRSRARHALSPALPRNVWLVLSVPLFTYQASKKELHSSKPENGSILFASHGLTWMAVPRQTTVSVQASSEVCVDNFRIRPLLMEPNQSVSLVPCFRGVSWRDPLTGANRTLLLDSSGLIAQKTDLDRAGSDGLEERQRQLELLTGNTTFIGNLGWFRFTGAFVLALCATFLFLLFTSTLCISIALTRRRRKSPSRLPLTSRIGYSGSQNQMFRPPDFAEDSLLPRMLQKSKPEEETQSSGTEPVSTENGESLFQHDGNTGRSMVVPEDGESETLDPMATSAVQLARNWFLYRNRGDRLRQRPIFYHLPPTESRQSPSLYPSTSSPAPSVSSPYALLKHPTDKMCKPAFLDNQLTCDPKPTSTSAANFRHSLVLAVDEQDQLIILPSAQSITSSMHRSTLHGANNSVREVDEEDEDELLEQTELTSSRQNTLPTIHQRSRSRTIDASGQDSDVSVRSNSPDVNA